MQCAVIILMFFKNLFCFLRIYLRGANQGSPKVFSVALPIRGGGGVLGALTNKNCVVRDERGLEEGWVTPFIKKTFYEHVVIML